MPPLTGVFTIPQKDANHRSSEPIPLAGPRPSEAGRYYLITQSSAGDDGQRGRLTIMDAVIPPP